MDYAICRQAGAPSAAASPKPTAKAILNQRMKLSRMRWTNGGRQQIVDLRTACRSKLGNRIWSRALDGDTTLPEANLRIPEKATPNLMKNA
jgi:hypothetical protein